MSRLRRLAKGLVLAALATGLCNSVGKKHRVVLANPGSQGSTVLAQSDQKAKANQGYAEAQRRIQQALVTQATELNLGGLSLTQLPPEIGQLTNLQSLDLKFNKLTQLPPEIGQLTNLQELDLTYNKLSSLPPEIGQLTNLQELDLQNDQQISLPPEIGQLTNLRELSFYGHQLSSIPPEILKLTSLHKLDLTLNQLTQLPPEIGQLTNLKWLSFSGNQLSSIPPEIGQLTNLQELDLPENQLTQLPPEILKLTNLRELNLRGNRLSSLPPEIGQLTNLQWLRLSENQLSNLPPEIGQLTNLYKLDLWDIQLSSLPPEIGQLTRLRALNLAKNQLRSLPPEIGQLTNLRRLFLWKNQLSSLPPEIGQLTQLQRLELWGNQLSSLPKEIQNLGLPLKTTTPGRLPELPDTANPPAFDPFASSIVELPPPPPKIRTIPFDPNSQASPTRQPSGLPKQTPPNISSPPLSDKAFEAWLNGTENLPSLPPVPKVSSPTSTPAPGRAASNGAPTKPTNIGGANQIPGNSEDDPTPARVLAPPTETVKRFVAFNYPKAACKNQLEGRAEYRIWVGPRGTSIVSGLVFSTGSEVLDQAVIVAAKRYKIKVEDSKKVISLPFDIKYSPEVCGASESTS